MNKTLKCALLAPSIAMMALTANAQTAAQPKLVEKVTRKGTELVIPYEKYVLPNGLTVILAEDHSDPLVHVDVTYHVGSAREEIGKSGFAHFFEHMMFQGSDHVANGDHFKIITEAGGTLNGSTNRDRTNYYETVPANQLEKMLWLESDRMGFLLDAVTQQKFEVQRATVKNERGQNYDNRPYGLAGEYTSKNLYPYGHPYSWLTIGYIEELNKVGVNDLKNFFLRWYGPNNATITIGGDLNPKQTLAWVSKYFGSIPRGPVVKNASFPMPVLTADRYISYTDNYAKLPLMSITYPGVKIYDKDMSALDALSEIIGQGRNSIFYKNFVKTRKAAQASMSSSNTELAGEITLSVIPFPGQTLADAKKLVDESLAEFEKTGVSDDALLRFKASAEANYINSLSSVSGKVTELAQAQYLTGNPNQIARELADIRAVTKEDVMRVYNKYIKGKPAVILSVLPKTGDVAAVAPNNYTVNTAGYKAPDYGYNGLTYKKATDNFNRSAKPGIGANPAIKVPTIWSATTQNGINIIGTQNSEIPTVSISMTIKGGGLYAVNNPSKAGLAGVVARMMNEDSKNYTAEQFNSELDKLGSGISVYAGSEAIYVSINSLTKNLPKTMTLLQEKLLNPKFTQDALDRIKKQTIEGLKQAKTQPAGVASAVYNKILYGQDNVRTYSTGGNEETVAAITLQDVQDYYDKYFTPSQTSIVVVGDVNQGTARGSLAFLNNWADKKVTIPTPAAGKTFDKTTLYLVDVPGAAQSEIRIGYLDKLNYDATGDYYKLGIANYILGGAFNSHINLNLREKKGWTYGARSGFNSGKYGGDFTASAGVLATATDSSVYEFIKEIKDYQKTGITPDELKFTQTSIGQSDARRYETNAQKAAFLSRIQEYNLKPTYVDEQNRILSTITPAELNKLSAKYLDTDKMVILVVGDKARILPGLQKLGYPIVELDSDGKPKQ
ncbi:M16 family metallopeptidase [Mucilaginibacter phyllosphaerae]|uniref:Insulinase family protein n=1 Tax=Mucilaginibacter phyllosphaerae TaxID=1812349 RepID=A0A4Y8A7W7_9SPHI|nr:pitrilysin family protein [Mucilaginibacter phyllosphaerae]MBB3970486.1 zinc protease [Mucilaginibacter phyllosphaerae]TEW64502.1 insulinase family protein [Mucilaginibacter phyllosphaerae]GGH19090.1 peptidase M16 [Mucilaginibacter phyllosphaerae]